MTSGSIPLVLWTLPFVATGVARPHASVAVRTVTSQVTAAVNPLRGGVVGPTASGATPLSEHAAARPLTRVAASASFSRRVMGHLGGTRAARTASEQVMERRIETGWS